MVTTAPHSDWPQAETRAEFAERTVAKLEKTIDDLEGMNMARLPLVGILMLLWVPLCLFPVLSSLILSCLPLLAPVCWPSHLQMSFTPRS